MKSLGALALIAIIPLAILLLVGGDERRTELPREALPVLVAIAQDGPFEYRQDGAVFANRERRLPPRPRGYYREYTVPTPGSADRGPRRIVTGGDPPEEFFYTADHYRTFRRFTP